MTKNEKIKQSHKETHLKRKTQYLKVFELKVDCHHTSKEDFQKLNDCFRQAKWVINDVIGSNDIFNYNYKDHRTVTNKDKDGNEVERKITLQTGIHQELVNSVKTDICNLSKAKKKGIKVGALKFRKNVNRIYLSTGMLKIKSSKTVSIPMFRKLSVYGLEQFINIPNFEIANANLIRKSSGFYIMVTVFFPKESNVVKTNKTVGLDFGIKTHITTSDNEKFNITIGESERLKGLQRKFARQVKGSNNRYKTLKKIKLEYERLLNKKKDKANKLVNHLCTNYSTVYMQDEMISGWHKGLFGKQVPSL